AKAVAAGRVRLSHDPRIAAVSGCAGHRIATAVGPVADAGGMARAGHGWPAAGTGSRTAQIPAGHPPCIRGGHRAPTPSAPQTGDEPFSPLPPPSGAPGDLDQGRCDARRPTLA